MKKTLLSVLCIITVKMLCAQSAFTPVATIEQTLSKPKNASGMSVMSIDTLDQYLVRATGLLIYRSQDGGFVYGPGYFNNAGNLIPISDATGCHYDGIGNASVTEVLLYVARKYVTGTADTLSVNVYSVNADSSANAVLGTSQITTDDLDTTGNLTSVLVNAAVTSSFLVSINYAGVDDTFGLVSSDPSMNDGAGEKRARQLVTAPFGGAWLSVDDVYGGSLDCDVMIIPIVDVGAGVEQFDTKNFTLKPIYPSPASDHIMLDYSLKNPSDVSYTIIDKSGKIIRSDKMTSQNTGNHSSKISTVGFASGNYYLTFNSGGKVLTQKFVVVK